MTKRITTAVLCTLLLIACTALAYAPRPPGLSLSAVSRSSLAADSSPLTAHCSPPTVQPSDGPVLSPVEGPTDIFQLPPTENPHICGFYCGNNPVNNIDPLGLTDQNAVSLNFSYVEIYGSKVTLDFNYRSATAFSTPYATHEQITVVLPPPPLAPYRPPELRAAAPIRPAPGRVATLTADHSGMAFMAHQATCGQYEFGSPIAESMATLPIEISATIMCPELGYVYLAANLRTLTDKNAPVDAKTLAMLGVALHRSPTPMRQSNAQFVFDRRIGRYRNTFTGRFVAQPNLPYPDNPFIWSKPTTLERGTVIDRYGRPSGKYAGVSGSTISERGMPPGSDALEYHRYKVIRPFEAEFGPASPVLQFDAKGYAMQYRLEKPLNRLVAEGFLEELF